MFTNIASRSAVVITSNEVNSPRSASNSISSLSASPIASSVNAIGPRSDSSENEIPSRVSNKRKLKETLEDSASGLSQQDLREMILALQKDKSLDDKEKSKRMQELMMRSWKRSQKRRKSISGKNKVLNDAASNSSHPYKHYVPSSNVPLQANKGDVIVPAEINTSYGCKHYKRGCNISAPCCNKFHPCRFCHDENSDHGINRYAVDRVQCMQCGKEQKVSNECVECGFHFARYYCAPCKFFDDETDKDIYHCPHCNLCRIGKGLGIDFFHCKKCNACMSLQLKEHKCIERSLESDCPVCNEFMFTSIKPVCFLPCGHTMHVECYDDYTGTNYVCPICSKSLANMSSYFKDIDKLLGSSVTPKELRGLKNRIFCADCEKRSEAPVHYLYHKCSHCKSYNTKVLERIAVAESNENNTVNVNR